MKIDWYKITESIIPVILLLSLIAFILMYVEYRSTQDSDRTHYIHISTNLDTESSDENYDNVVEDDFSNDPRIIQAHELVDKARFKEAENIYFKVLAKEPSAQVYNWLGALYLKDEKYSKAVVALSSSIDNNPNYYRAYYNLALAYNELDEYDKAVKNYKKVIKLVNTHVKAHLNLGLLYYKQKDYIDAIEIFKKSVTLSSGDKKVKAYYLMAKCYANQKPPQKKKALQAYGDAIRLNPAHIPSRLGIIQIKYSDDQGGYNKQISALKKLLKLEPDNILIYRALSDIYLKLSKEELALQNLKQALLNKPNNISLQFETVSLLVKLKKYNEAILILENILKQRPKKIKALLILGELHYIQDDYKLSLEVYNKILDIKKTGTYELWNKMGILYSRTKQYKKAKVSYKKALKMRSDYPEAYYNIGLLYLKQNDIQNAKVYFEKAIAFRKNYKQAYNQLADIYEKENNPDKVIEMYEKIVSFYPNSIKDRLKLAIRYSQSDQYDQAKKLYEKILKEDNSYYNAWLNLGLVLYNQKDYNASISALEKAITLESSEKAYRLLAKSYDAIKQHQKSIEILKKLLEKNPSSIKTRLAYARSFYRIRDKDTALEEYIKVLKLDPNNKVASKMIKKIQIKQRKENAKKQ